MREKKELVHALYVRGMRKVNFVGIYHINRNDDD